MKNDEGGPASLSPADSGSKIVNDTCSAVSATAEITTAHFMESKSPDMTAIAIVNKEPISLSSPLQKSAASNNNKKTSAPAQQQRRPVVDNDTRNNQPRGGQGANDSVAQKCCCACLECCAELSDSDGENIVSCLCALCEACDSD